MKENSQVLHGSMYRVLTQDTWDRGECKDKHRPLMESLHQTFGPHATVDDLADLGTEDMPLCDLYEDNSQNVETFLSLDKKRGNPIVGGQNLNADI